MTTFKTKFYCAECRRLIYHCICPTPDAWTSSDRMARPSDDRNHSSEDSDDMGLPKPTETAGEVGVPFLKARVFGKAGTKGKITFAGEPRQINGEYGEQIVQPVTVNGKRYDWAFAVNSGNHRRLYALFGDKTPKGTVDVTVKDGASGHTYVALV